MWIEDEWCKYNGRKILRGKVYTEERLVSNCLMLLDVLLMNLRFLVNASLYISYVPRTEEIPTPTRETQRRPSECRVPSPVSPNRQW